MFVPVMDAHCVVTHMLLCVFTLLKIPAALHVCDRGGKTQRGKRRHELKCHHSSSCTHLFSFPLWLLEAWCISVGARPLVAQQSLATDKEGVDTRLD